MLFALLVLGLFTNQVHSQDPETSNYQYGWQMRGAVSSSGEMPFWLHSNRFDALDRHSANAVLNLSGRWERKLESGLSVSAGGNVLIRGADDSAIRLQEGYVQTGYGHFVLWGGRKREDFGLVQRELSSGTTDLSHNARPIPKITFATDGFQSVPGTQNALWYDASLSHGWMHDNEYRYVEDAYLHQKHFYLRIFGENAPVVPMAGIKHFAHWGGESPDHGTIPDGFRDYVDVFFALSEDVKEIFDGGQLLNRYQNHMGTYDFALQFNLERYRISLSRQFILEDTPNARFGTPFDGLWGAYVERRPATQTSWRSEPSGDSGDDYRPFLRAALYEYLDTIEGVNRYDHRDKGSYFNYYNHSRYRGGWAYHNRSLGNPLLYTDRNYIGVVNNLLIAHHAGLLGHAGPVDWRFFGTYSRNYGASGATTLEGNRSTRVTDRRDQWSFMLELSSTKLHPTLEASTTLAYDTGEVYGDNFGVMVSLRWRGSS